VEPKRIFPKKKMGFDFQEGFAKSDETGDVKNQVWCELVKLHTVYKEKPTNELMGRERETTKEEGEEHYPVAALGLRDALGAGEDNLVAIGDKTIGLSLVRSVCLKIEGTQLVAALAVFLLPVLFFYARCLTRIHDLRMGAMKELRGTQDCNNGGGGRSNETGKQ
jgi:hypothetical protein